MDRLVRRLIVSPKVRRAAVGLAVLAVAPAVKAAQPGEGALLTKPVAWAAAASPAQTAALYPPGAKGVGFANLGCLLGPGGTLKDCRVVGEAPAGVGFGGAAMALSVQFKAKASPGEEGASILLPIEFDPPETLKGAPRPPIDPIDCLAPLCRLEIAPGSAAPAAAPLAPQGRP
jgi:hypothetical protein